MQYEMVEYMCIRYTRVDYLQTRHFFLFGMHLSTLNHAMEHLLLVVKETKESQSDIWNFNIIVIERYKKSRIVRVFETPEYFGFSESLNTCKNWHIRHVNVKLIVDYRKY